MANISAGMSGFDIFGRWWCTSFRSKLIWTETVREWSFLDPLSHCYGMETKTLLLPGCCTYAVVFVFRTGGRRLQIDRRASRRAAGMMGNHRLPHL